MVDIQRNADVQKAVVRAWTTRTAEGAAYASVANWQAHVVVDGRLITSQPPVGEPAGEGAARGAEDTGVNS